MELSKSQKKFIIETFFELTDYAGAKNIGESLLTKGFSIVPGDACIFIGGIGNFINIESADEYVDCVKYVFDLEVFISSKLFQSAIRMCVEEKENKIKEREKRLNKSKQKVTELKSLYEIL